VRQPTLDFGRDLCTDPQFSTQREWLATNGIGGYASGTVSGVLTRRYHGLLLAALQPPVGRTLLLAKLDETATYDGAAHTLFADRWADGRIEPQGYRYLERFHTLVDSHQAGTIPVWTFAFSDAQLEKRVWMQHGANTTFVTYHHRRGSQPIELSIKALVNHRDHHAITREDDWQARVEPAPNGLQITVDEGAPPLYLLTDRAKATPCQEWSTGYYLSVEDYRGLPALDDNLHAGTFRATLQPGESLTLVAGTEPHPVLDSAAAYAAQQAHERQLLASARPHLEPMTPAIEQLILAADQFIVRRTLPADPEGRSVIAGYPWFSDWGRDTMISLPGLALTTGRHDLAASILRTFAHYLDRGMLPNRFPDEGQAPEYNTVDATLWYFEAIRAYYQATQDDALLRNLYPALRDIVDWHQRGTRYQIQVDPADGLLCSGQEGVQLTWMDAKVDDWVVTPRQGKAVEINALWYNALRIMAAFAALLGESPATYDTLADQAASSFSRFWNDEAGYCYDLIDGPGGDDPALRPNQLFAVSLVHSPLPKAQQRAVVDACARHLLTSHGLRSLAPHDPAYIGHYGGDRRTRDAAYHQGTTWGWLIGPFVSAHLRVYRDPATARSFLQPLLHQLASHGLGSLSEVFEGDPPFTPRGCIAQAWTVAEVLRAWRDSACPQVATR
jgi:predicted glycogen debranching enzyme